jgi:hypothetical protein
MSFFVFNVGGGVGFMQSSGYDVRRAHIDMKSEAATCLILEGVVEMMPQKYFLARTCFVIFRVLGKPWLIVDHPSPGVSVSAFPTRLADDVKMKGVARVTGSVADLHV